MTYRRPNWFVRSVFNPIAMRFGISGTQTLVVAGRSTGASRQIPVIPVDRDGVRYVVSTRGESEWVRNLRRSGTAELRTKQGSRTYRATEIPVAERAPIIDAYRKVAGRTVDAYWKAMPDPADHPTFRLDPA